MKPRRFAFGKFSIHGCDCPTRAAAFKGHDPWFVISLYDDALKKLVGVPIGTVSEKEAASAWMDAIMSSAEWWQIPEHDGALIVAALLGWATMLPAEEGPMTAPAGGT